MPKDPVEVVIKMQAVRVVEMRGPDTALVEWEDQGLHRALIPAGEIIEGAVSVETLSLGIPYGLPWEQLLTLSATPEALAAELRANGIWSLEDLEKNPRAAVGALQKVYGVDLSALLRAA